MKVAIFPGHVGKDAGAVDAFGNDNIYTIEPNITASISAYLSTFLKLLNIQPKICTGSFTQRIIESKESDLGVSIHCDSISDKDIKGFHLIHWPESKTAIRLAGKIEKEMLEQTTIPQARQTHTSTNLKIISGTTFPTVLIETGFVSNTEEEYLLHKPQTQIFIAHSIATAIQKI